MTEAKKLYSKGDERITQATKEYLRACQMGRQEFAKQTPDMLKYQPKRFWGMFRNTASSTADVSAKSFAEYN
jgi:hypothetical protein